MHLISAEKAFVIGIACGEELFLRHLGRMHNAHNLQDPVCRMLLNLNKFRRKQRSSSYDCLL